MQTKESERIARLELIARIAIRLGHKPRTVQKWRERGWVPHMHRFQITQLAAAAEGVTLDWEQFDRFGRGRRGETVA
jgi:hypothetical protein